MMFDGRLYKGKNNFHIYIQYRFVLQAARPHELLNAATVDSVCESSSLCLLSSNRYFKVRSLHHVTEQIRESCNLFGTDSVFVKPPCKRATAINAKYATLAINCKNTFYICYTLTTGKCCRCVLYITVIST